MNYNACLIVTLIITSILLTSCTANKGEATKEEPIMTEKSSMSQKYTEFELTTDMSVLDEEQTKMIGLLIEAAEIMDKLFWYEAYGDKDSLLASISEPELKNFALINYGPWDRLDNNKVFIEGIPAKEAGANFYPSDITKEEFDSWENPNKKDQYSFVRRTSEGGLKLIPYHQKFKNELEKASSLLQQASELAKNEGLKQYLSLRAEALLNDNYRESDLAWLDMKTNQIDVVIGPIENYEDQLYGYRTAHEAYVLVKDMEWSKRLEKYAAFLPALQKGLPVGEEYKREEPGSDTELNAYDVIYYAGDCNAGSKTIAINLPNDEEVQLAKGTRRLQLKNAMRAKYEKILVPIADVLIEPDQRKHISFDAFFTNTMFHEVAHGLGIKNTINNKGTVRESLKELFSALEEGKADMLGLFMVSQLHERGEIEGDLMDYYITFMAGIFRSVRFGASSAHGKANMIRFNFFDEQGAFERNTDTGQYKINAEKMTLAMNSLSEKILTLQGDGDYEGVKKLVDDYGLIGEALQGDLKRLNEAGIPVDVVFKQGKSVLGI